jgi:hypothetical protein
MTSTDTFPPLPGAHDALFDDIERRLLALTTVALSAPAAVPRRCVDEFEDGFPLPAGPLGLTARQLARRWEDPLCN